MQLKGYSQRTQEAYCNAVRQLAAHVRRSPDLLTEEDLWQYFLFLTREKKVARATALSSTRLFTAAPRGEKASVV